MARLIVLTKILLFCVVAIGSQHACFAAVEIKEPSDKQKEEKLTASKAGDDHDQPATVPDASDEPVMTSHSVTVGRPNCHTLPRRACYRC